MSLPHDAIQDAARRLFAAEKNRKQIRQLSIEFPGMTIDDAYAVQKALVDLKVTAGAVVRGHKIGLTSKAMQSALNIDEPDSGVLLDDMFFNDGGIVPADRFIATRVEAELAFVIKHRLAGPDCTIFDVLNATDFVVPALEILDTRVERLDPQTKATRKIVDTIAANAACPSGWDPYANFLKLGPSSVPTYELSGRNLPRYFSIYSSGANISACG